jgi:hypothetical protein
MAASSHDNNVTMDGIDGIDNDVATDSGKENCRPQDEPELTITGTAANGK